MSKSPELHKLGIHLVVDAWDCNPELLDDEQRIKEIAIGAAHVSGATLINICTHHFSPQGVTATATLAESHLAIHTWPEHNYLGMDIFFCGEGDPHWAAQYVILAAEAANSQIREMDRGIPANASQLSHSFAA